jgi:hypothetical protein
MSNEEKRLYYYEDKGRCALIEGRFFALPSQVKKLKGKTVFLGEAEGKHSDVAIRFEPGEIKEVPISSELKKLAEKEGVSLVYGYNPFEYICCAVCGRTLEDIDNDLCNDCQGTKDGDGDLAESGH